MRPRDVPARVAGSVRVRVADLRKKLGDAAWYTLLALWSCRSHKTGETTATNAGLCRAPGFARQALRVVRKAAARLRAAGLLACRGWQRRFVPQGRARVERSVYVRLVRGAYAEGVLGAEDWLLVPGATSAWLSTACSWGGARRGAAMRRNAPAERSTETTETRIDSVQGGPTPGGSRGAADLLSRSPTNSLRFGSPPLRGGGAATGAAEASLREVGEGGARPGEEVAAFGLRVAPPPSTPARRRGGTKEEPAPPTPPSAAPAAVGDVPRAPWGARLSGVRGVRPRPPAMATAPLAGVPPYPGFDLLGWPAVPQPPLLDPEAGALERASRLADAYRGAVRKRYGVAPWALRPGAPLASSKFFRPLADAAAALVELGVAPAAWAAWSCDVWRRYHGGAKPPPVPWVFSAKRVRERADWFAREELAYKGGRLVVGPRVRNLVRRYLAMRNAIALAGMFDDPEPVVEVFFPGSSYEVHLDAAKREVAATRARLRAEADRGEFLW